MADLTEVTRETFEEKVLQAEKAALVYYNTAWCKQGQEMLETIQAAAEEVGDKMLFFSVDTDKEDIIVQKQGVRTIPTIHFLNGGKRVDQLRGAISKLDVLGKVSNVLSGESENGGASADATPPDESE